MKRLSYEDVYNCYKNNGCELLSTTYKNNKERLHFKCRCGNEEYKSFKEFEKNPFCFQCSSNRRLTIQEVKQFVEDKACKLVSTEYKNNSTKLKYECYCGEPFEKSFDSFKAHPQCKKCGYIICGQKQSYTYEQVYEKFIQGGCLLIEKEYKNKKQKLKYICECGNSSTISLDVFMRGSRCKDCGYSKSANYNRHSFEFVKSVFNNRNCILLSSEYMNNKTKLHYICSCGNEDWTTFDYFVNNLTTCEKCANKRKSDFHKYEMEYVRGEEHPNWDHSKTQEEREKNRWLSEQKVWRKHVYERDNYTCQCCGDNKGGNLISHHLDGYDWCKENRWGADNGITLCTSCHNDFHHVYGYGSNTREQFEEYMEGISWNCVGIYKDSNLVVKLKDHF